MTAADLLDDVRAITHGERVTAYGIDRNGDDWTTTGTAHVTKYGVLVGPFWILEGPFVKCGLADIVRHAREDRWSEDRRLDIATDAAGLRAAVTDAGMEQ